MVLIPQSLHKLNCHRDNRTFFQAEEKIKEKSTPMTVCHMAETRSSKGAIQHPPCAQDHGRQLTQQGIQKPYTMQLHSGISLNSAGFGSRRHGSMQLLLVETNILRRRKSFTDWRISALKGQFEICSLKISLSPSHRAFLVLVTGPARCPRSAAPALPKLKTGMVLLI